jgi:hypothetical protein
MNQADRTRYLLHRIAAGRPDSYCRDLYPDHYLAVWLVVARRDTRTTCCLTTCR